MPADMRWQYRPAEHRPEDLLLARELVVERPPGHAGGLGQLVHTDGAEATFQEQALSAARQIPRCRST